tara:strand:+ start:1571 stop:1807 length:237 start_codon:yes stop_codon:yes gene_type:complete
MHDKESSMKNRQALKITINLIRHIMPLILSLLRAVEEAKQADSDGGKKVTNDEKWAIAQEASLNILPALVEGISDALE